MEETTVTAEAADAATNHTGHSGPRSSRGCRRRAFCRRLWPDGMRSRAVTADADAHLKALDTKFKELEVDVAPPDLRLQTALV